MKIKQLISKAIKEANLFDTDGMLISQKRVNEDYKHIKNYLLTHYSSEKRVGLYLTKSPVYLLTMLACMDIGLTYIPLKSDWPIDRIHQIEEVSECEIIDDELMNEILCFDEVPSISSFEVFDKKILYIMFTSGTTGVPKGVEIRRESYLNYIEWMDDFYEGVSSQDRLLLTTDFTFDMSLADIGFFLIRHVSVYVSSFSNNIFQLLYELEKYKITMHRTVPYTYTMLFGSGMFAEVDLSNLKTIVFAGARFPYSLYEHFKEHFPKTNVYNLYGPTEATIDVTGHKLLFDETDVDKHNVSIGKEITNNQIRLIDKELYISGVQVMSGYLKDEKRSNDVLIEEDSILYYKTGDLAYKDSEGRYYIVGRSDDTVKISGFRVNLLDIDAYIQAIDFVKDSATVLMEDSRSHDSYLVTFLILNIPKEKKEIYSRLKTKLLPYQIAKKLVLLEAFPLNSNGKVDKKVLKQSLEK